mmetsp:Transcript_17601/g.26082  ORF Transcript_17601/g.26082 Transcript_17601/m.26082 type:complete len:328 (-) Transcript_17601:110-1093(-)|eukprot:CAMPEP_0194040678 /NCGR_PEP_ID=MMETSP0009_2-20130614/12641_1 /TAXON_ID=210454 /ORGANISM="Grammatophora oceanica, Strain CCMP 410" /LENGTH=327 /DNA_ID=CAMNT_0038683889 /DNA_START=159 /DNA_END=1142 /DNA_ORIENTATION=+
MSEGVKVEEEHHYHPHHVEHLDAPKPIAPQPVVEGTVEAGVHDAVADLGDHAAAEALEAAVGKAGSKKRRLCRYPGCTKVIKSQGHCQRHGARAKRCKVDGCEKQAQGTHDGMCKRHWKAKHFPPQMSKSDEQPPPPDGDSVYDTILPQSISYRPHSTKLRDEDKKPGFDPLDPPQAPDGVSVMPLVQFLADGSKEPAGWHRNDERRARGMFPVVSLASQLEPWERQLALVEILLLSGGTPYANFKDLAHGWGREKGFHHLLVSSVCERRGEVERKKRSDAGREIRKRPRMSEEQSHIHQEMEMNNQSVEEMVNAAVGPGDPDLSHV